LAGRLLANRNAAQGHKHGHAKKQARSKGWAVVLRHVGAVSWGVAGVRTGTRVDAEIAPSDQADQPHPP
jgi:hypothetical protein